MGESSRHAIERPGHNTDLREATMLASGVILSLVKEAAAFAPCAELKQAAAVALIIFETIQAVKDNKEAYKQLADDSTGLIVAIWRSLKKAESPMEWLSADMQEILVELTHILDRISSFVREKLARNKAMRLIHSRADVGKIAEYRQNLNSAMQKFELQSHMNIDLKLGKLSEQIRYRNGEDIKRILEITAREARDQEEAERIHEEELKVVKKISKLEHLRQNQLEIDHQAEDEPEQSEELKKREKDKHRQSELERLRAAVRAVEMANRSKKEEEDEMVELRRKIAAGRRIMPQAQPSKNKRSSTQEDQVEDEEDWRREEEEIGRMKTRLNVKTNSRRSLREPHGALETFTDDEEESLQRSKMKKARRKLSSTPHNFEETKDRDQPTDEERKPRFNVKTDSRRSSREPHGALETFTDDEEESLKRSKMRTARRKLSSNLPHFEETKDRDQPTDEERKTRFNVKTDSRRSSREPHGVLETFTDDEEESLKRSKMRTARRKLSGTPHHFEETKDRDQPTDEERSPSPKKNPKVVRKPQISPGSPPREVDDLMAQFQGFGTPLGGSPYGSGSNSPMYYPPYGPPLPPSMAPDGYGYGYGYGYGGGGPGTIVNTGIGNITHTTISNVGNDNSVKKIYRAPRNQRT